MIKLPAIGTKVSFERCTPDHKCIDCRSVCRFVGYKTVEGVVDFARLEKGQDRGEHWHIAVDTENGQVFIDHDCLINSLLAKHIERMKDGFQEG